MNEQVCIHEHKSNMCLKDAIKKCADCTLEKLLPSGRLQVSAGNNREDEEACRIS